LFTNETTKIYQYVVKFNKGNDQYIDIVSFKEYIFKMVGIYPKIILLGVSCGLKINIGINYHVKRVYNINNYDKYQNYYRDIPQLIYPFSSLLDCNSVVSIQVPILITNTQQIENIRKFEELIIEEIILADMETYSISSLCRTHNISFDCYRVSTDLGVGKQAKENQYKLFSKLCSEVSTNIFNNLIFNGNIDSLRKFYSNDLKNSKNK